MTSLILSENSNSFPGCLQGNIGSNNISILTRRQGPVTTTYEYSLKAHQRSTTIQLNAERSHRPKNFTWDELTALLKSLGYVESKKGKTGRSRRRFVHASAATISLHQPHPNKELKQYVIDQVLTLLDQEGML